MAAGTPLSRPGRNAPTFDQALRRRLGLRSIVASIAGLLPFTTSRRVSSIRACQPFPVDLKYSITSGLMRSVSCFLVGDLLGPRSLRIDAARSGKTSPNGRALAKSAFVSSGLSLTSRRSFAPYPAFFLALFIKFPFVAAGGPHADDAHALAAEPREHHDDDAARMLTPTA